jgi:RimJ/RimL family protein N-acetyltransferase
MTLLERRPKVRSAPIGPALETARLRLRAPRRADIEAVARLANDRRIAENTASMPHPYTLADAEDFLQRVAAGPDEIAFAISLEDGTLIGVCGLKRDGRGKRGNAPEIGYWLGVPFWGQGYATEAARALVDHAFEDLELERLEADARVSNPASRRVLEKCGFQWEGVALRRVRAIGSSTPIDRFRLDRGLWASLKAWGQSARAPRRVA